LRRSAKIERRTTAVKKTLHAVEVVTPAQAAERALPEEVQLSLGEIAGAAKEGLLALAVGTGLAVLHEAMEHEVSELAGPKGRHDADRCAYRHGHTGGEVTLGGRRVAVERPRVRAADGSGELGLASYQHFAADDLLSRVVLERMLAGVSARRFARMQEPVGEQVEQDARSTSKSAVSRRVVEGTRHALEALMSRRLGELELAALMIDGLDLDERCNVVALGITHDGRKLPLGLWEGSTENATVASALLADVQDRGLDCSGGVLVVIDGAKALAKAVRQVLGAGAVVARCQRHKECHEAVTSGAAITLEDVGVFERSRDAAVRWARLGDPSGAVVRGHAGRGGHRRGLDCGRRGRLGDARLAAGRRWRLGVPGDDERLRVGS
jgi:hypothetical protein